MNKLIHIYIFIKYDFKTFFYSFYDDLKETSKLSARRLLYFFSILFILMFILKACDQQLHETEDLYDNNKVPEFLKILSVGIEGLYFQFGEKIAQFLIDEQV